MTTGRLYQIRFNNPYRTPPDGRPRILAEMFVLAGVVVGEAFTAEQIAAKPDYYLAGTSDHDAAREAILEDERATYNRMLATHGQLIIHTSDSSDPSANP